MMKAQIVTDEGKVIAQTQDREAIEAVYREIFRALFRGDYTAFCIRELSEKEVSRNGVS